MSMSMHVLGFIPPDDQWKRMAAIWAACEAAGIDPPIEVESFFGGDPPDALGREVNLGEAVSEYVANGEEGYSVDLSKLPDHVKHLRFYCSW